MFLIILIALIVLGVILLKYIDDITKKKAISKAEAGPMASAETSTLLVYIIIEKGANFYVKSIPLRKDFKGNKIA